MCVSACADDEQKDEEQRLKIEDGCLPNASASDCSSHAWSLFFTMVYLILWLHVCLEKFRDVKGGYR